MEKDLNAVGPGNKAWYFMLSCGLLFFGETSREPRPSSRKCYVIPSRAASPWDAWKQF